MPKPRRISADDPADLSGANDSGRLPVKIETDEAVE